MAGLAWFTSAESGEDVGIPVRRIRTVHELWRAERAVVAIHLDGGEEIHVLGPLPHVQDLIARIEPSGRVCVSQTALTSDRRRV